MTSTTETGTVYQKLRRHYLADGANELPQRKEVMKILELQFTPEEAELALSIPVTPTGILSLAEIAEKTGKTEDEVWPILESLLTKGPLYMQLSRRTGEEKYNLWDFFYGILTPMTGDGIVTDTKRRVAELRESLWDAGVSYFQNPSSHGLGGRVMPYEPTLDPDSPVPDYERYSYFIKNADDICVVACGCRMNVGKCREPVFNCMHFNQQVEYWVKYRRGHRLSREEALTLIEDQVKGGLVVTGANTQQAPLVFCTCCADCCVILRPFIEDHITHSVVKSNYLPEWDLEKCKVCSTCRKACPPDAIGRHLSHVEGERDHMIVMEARCFGCGVCSAACPREAITMKRVREHVPDPTYLEAMPKHQAAMLW